MAPDPLTQIDLAAVVAGQREATTALTRALLPRVRNLVRYLLTGDQDVDDVTQLALITVLRGLSGFRGTGRLEKWVDRVVVRATFGWLRHRRIEARHIAPEVDPTEAPDGREMPDEYLERRRAIRILDALPDEQRHALVLHHVLGMSVPEIAETTATPPETIRSRLRLGRARLRDTCSAVVDQEAG